MILMGGVWAAALSVALLGQVSFLTTGVTVKGQAVLFAISDASLPLKRNLCLYLTRASVRQEPVVSSRDQPNVVGILAAHFLGSVLMEEGK